MNGIFHFFRWENGEFLKKSKFPLNKTISTLLSVISLNDQLWSQIVPYTEAHIGITNYRFPTATQNGIRQDLSCRFPLLADLRTQNGNSQDLSC